MSATETRRRREASVSDTEYSENDQDGEVNMSSHCLMLMCCVGKMLFTAEWVNECLVIYYYCLKNTCCKGITATIGLMYKPVFTVTAVVLWLQQQKFGCTCCMSTIYGSITVTPFTFHPLDLSLALQHDKLSVHWQLMVKQHSKLLTV